SARDAAAPARHRAIYAAEFSRLSAQLDAWLGAGYQVASGSADLDDSVTLVLNPSEAAAAALAGDSTAGGSAPTQQAVDAIGAAVAEFEAVVRGLPGMAPRTRRRSPGSTAARPPSKPGWA